MRRFFPTGLILLFVLAISAPAFAGGFLGASAGQATLEDSAFSFDFNSHDFAWKAYGGFRWKLLKVEGGYIDFGSHSDSAGPYDFNADVTGWTAAAHLVIPVGSVLELSAKAGVINWDSSTVLVGPGGTSEDDNGLDAVYGVGVGFRLGEPLALRIEWEKFDVSFTDELWLGSVGLEFRF
jgi:outer membrane protein with beta-barrel domain